MKPALRKWIPYFVRTAGHPKELTVVNLKSKCGEIENGIAFAFDGEGSWVVDFNDLRHIMEQAEKARR